MISYFDFNILQVTSRAIDLKQVLSENEWIQEGDELLNTGIEKEADAAKSTTIPSKLKAVIKFGYDEGMKNRLSRQGKTFEQWIVGVLAHAQAHFKHPSLGTEIEFEVSSMTFGIFTLTLILLSKITNNKISFFPYISQVQGTPLYKAATQWTADRNIHDARRATLAANLKDVDTMSWWCNEGGGGVAGIAFVGALCSSYNINLNEYWSSQSGAAFVS